MAKLSIVLSTDRETCPLNRSLKSTDVHGVTHNTLRPTNYNSKRLTHSESQTPNIHTYTYTDTDRHTHTHTHTNRIMTYLQHDNNSITARGFRKTNTTITTNIITVWLTSLAQSVCIKPNYQGLTWSECDGLGNDELITRVFCLIDSLENLLILFLFSQRALILYMF